MHANIPEKSRNMHAKPRKMLRMCQENGSNMHRISRKIQSRHQKTTICSALSHENESRIRKFSKIGNSKILENYKARKSKNSEFLKILRVCDFATFDFEYLKLLQFSISNFSIFESIIFRNRSNFVQKVRIKQDISSGFSIILENNFNFSSYRINMPQACTKSRKML